MRWALLDRFLRGECDADEHAEVERWAAESPRYRQALEELAASCGHVGDGASARLVWDALRRELDAGAEDEDDPGSA